MHDREGSDVNEVGDSGRRSTAYGWILGGLVGLATYVGLTAIGTALYVTGNIPVWAARVTGWIIVCIAVGLSIVVILAFRNKELDQVAARSSSSVGRKQRSRDPRRTTSGVRA